MKYQITYDLDYSSLGEITDYIQRALGENSALAESVQAAGDFATQEWIQTAASKFRHSSGGYARGILTGVRYPFASDPLHFKIEHQSKNANALEFGYDSFDMKKALQTSDKVRISKEGKRYLIIPFRHGTPGTKSIPGMPKGVYESAPIAQRVVDGNGSVRYEVDSSRSGAKNLRHSVATGTFREGSIRGATSNADADLLRSKNVKKVIRNTYKWGDKLMDVDYPKLKAHHRTNIYEGMVRFQANPNVNREMMGGKFTGSNRTESMGDYSTYMTFRIMHEDSPGWIHPGLRPMNILGETVKRIEGPVLQMMADGAKKDLEKFFNNVS